MFSARRIFGNVDILDVPSPPLHMAWKNRVTYRRGKKDVRNRGVAEGRM